MRKPPPRPKRPAPTEGDPPLDPRARAVVDAGVTEGFVGEDIIKLSRQVYTRTLLRAAKVGDGRRLEKDLVKRLACEVLRGIVGYAISLEELDRLLDGDDRLVITSPTPDEAGEART